MRGRSLLGQLRGTGPEYKPNTAEKIAKALTLWHSKSNLTQAVADSLKLLGDAVCYLAFDGRGNHQNQYCPACFEPVKWRRYLRKILEESVTVASFTNGDKKLTWTEWVNGHLKSFVKQQLKDLPREANDWEKIKGKLQSPDGMKDKLVLETISASLSNKCNVRIDTIHGVKGETFDAVMLVSAARSGPQGGHVDSWFKDSSTEHARFAYVACSRPRTILILAVPPRNKSQRETLEKMGFRYKLLADINASS